MTSTRLEGLAPGVARLTGPVRGVIVFPTDRDQAPGVGVVVLSGSSGRVDEERAALFAAHGAIAIAVGYFGGLGEPPGICEVPLETVTGGIDALEERGCTRVGLVGLSKGAEAALVVATLDPRVDAVVALAPTSVVWANVGAGLDGADRPLRSSWTWRGSPLPFVPYDPDWIPPSTGGPPAFRGLYEVSVSRYPTEAAAAEIRIERSTARVVAVAGGDDQVWPSGDFARQLAARRPGGAGVDVIVHPDGGHRPILPGESRQPGGADVARGGTVVADAELGVAAWPFIVAALGINAER